MQFSIKKIVILKNLIELTWTKAQADFNLWTAVHKHETLTIEIWWYSIKSFDPKKLTESLNCHAVLCILSLDVVSYLNYTKSLLAWLLIPSYSGQELPLSVYEDHGHCIVINKENSFILGMAKEAAEQAYITKVEQMKGTYGF